ncbi:MAG: methanogenesis marker 17 protein [Candidatus Lokiarchaeota archaeon]|nr:methanogenesis marker 17 protein [Candidatus Lokiarchaeota archaeon]
MNQKIFVESINEQENLNHGIIKYKIIADYIVQDLAINKFIEILRIIIDIENCLFSIYIKMGDPSSPKTLEDISSIMPITENKFKIVLKDETVAPQYMKLLWSKVGKDNVNQIDRYESELIFENITKEEIEKLITKLRRETVIDPNEKMKYQIFDVINRIIPIGFRVRKYFKNFSKSNNDEILVVASENPVFEEQVENIKEKLSHFPIQMDEKFLEGFIQKPTEKKFERFKPWKKR